MKKTKEQMQEILVEMAEMEAAYPKATIIYNFNTNSIEAVYSKSLDEEAF